MENGNGTTITTSQKVTYNTYDMSNTEDTDETYGNFDRRGYRSAASTRVLKESLRFFRNMTPKFIPGNFEEEHDGVHLLGRNGGMTSSEIVDEDIPHCKRHHRGFRRRLFLFLAEPSSSWSSAIFFLVLIIAIFASNLIIIMQTMSSFQYQPTECDFCEKDGGYFEYFEAHTTSASDVVVVECVCPLRPQKYLERFLGYILKFFAFEWTLRVLSYVPAQPPPDIFGRWCAWLKFLTSPTTLLDALAIWPFFIERYHLPGLVSLRLIRLLRVFLLLRLGSYNSMFVSLTSVLYKSIGFLKLLMVILFFGATIFGSLLFWLEQGEWKYWEPTGDFQYVRMSIDGKTEEISPFRSIPSAFWWFVVTATTVGYGDYYPTSTAGQWVSVCAMLTGVLVIAFPVSVFSDLWSEELKEVKGLESLFETDSSDDNKTTVDNFHKERECTETNRHIEAQLFQNEYQKLNLDDHHQSQNSSHIVMERQDLNEIISSIRSIHEEQRRIQLILRKYATHESNPH